MQKSCSAAVPLLMAFVCLFPAYEGLFAFAPAAKVHSVALGSIRKVNYTLPDSQTALPLTLRPLVVDGHQKEWTTGEAHDVTDRSFVIRRVLKINDALPGEAAKWSWQPGPWLLVDRATGHVTALHLQDFDPVVSRVVWYRDYAAYCGLSTTARMGGLYFFVSQLNNRKAVVQKKLGAMPPQSTEPVCDTIAWQRDPLRVSVTPKGADALTFSVQGTAASLVEDGEDEGD